MKPEYVGYVNGWRVIVSNGRWRSLEDVALDMFDNATSLKLVDVWIEVWIPSEDARLSFVVCPSKLRRIANEEAL